MKYVHNYYQFAYKLEKECRESSDTPPENASKFIVHTSMLHHLSAKDNTCISNFGI